MVSSQRGDRHTPQTHRIRQYAKRTMLRVRVTPGVLIKPLSASVKRFFAMFTGKCKAAVKPAML